MSSPLDDARKEAERQRETYERYMVRKVLEWHLGGSGKTENPKYDVPEAAEIDRRRREKGLPPTYGNYGVPGRLRDYEGSPIPAATTPKIYGGGDGSNHDPPVGGAAAVQRVRSSAEAERRHRERLLSTAH